MNIINLKMFGFLQIDNQELLNLKLKSSYFLNFIKITEIYLFKLKRIKMKKINSISDCIQHYSQIFSIL